MHVGWPLSMKGMLTSVQGFYSIPLRIGLVGVDIQCFFFFCHPLPMMGPFVLTFTHELSWVCCDHVGNVICLRLFGMWDIYLGEENVGRLFYLRIIPTFKI